MKELIKFFRYASNSELKKIFDESNIDEIYNKNTEEEIFLKVLQYLSKENINSYESIVYTTKFDRLKKIYPKITDDCKKFASKIGMPVVLKPITYFLNAYSYEVNIKSLNDDTYGIDNSITFSVYVRNLPEPNIRHSCNVLNTHDRFYCGDAVYRYDMCDDCFTFVMFSIDKAFINLMDENYTTHIEPSAPPSEPINNYIDNILKKYERCE